ncbi:TetR family transcriptional regulator [Nocardiopsis sp. EMB25]|uniref:TetR family transcriptional regulator n=1 Tax=Nocardiopsis sp. EMB25 TaxID=2835867 RepID=UPI002284DAF0|nr:TetR family transcriptional regulator [Nocardiopsis sp. EMB25]MCY9783536.1 TetR family transcriptional regulator [Nocardiopsis sp. EMB25]
MADWRADKRARTRAAIQEAALDLFARHGYDQVTVERVAAAAGVSHTTFFRYFPTKEDVVLGDDYDPLIARHVSARTETDPVERVRLGIAEAFTHLDTAALAVARERTLLMLSAPSLRARVWENQATTQRLLERVLHGADSDRIPLATRAVAAACTAVLTTTVTTWAEDGPTEALPSMVDEALAALRPPTP